MISIFNRKKLTSTVHMRLHGRIRDILTANGIDYYLKVKNLADGNIMPSARTFNLAGADISDNNMDYTREYTFYVHRDDYAKALKLLRGGRLQ